MYFFIYLLLLSSIFVHRSHIYTYIGTYSWDFMTEGCVRSGACWGHKICTTNPSSTDSWYLHGYMNIPKTSRIRPCRTFVPASTSCLSYLGYCYISHIYTVVPKKGTEKTWPGCFGFPKKSLSKAIVWTTLVQGVSTTEANVGVSRWILSIFCCWNFRNCFFKQGSQQLCQP